MSGPPVQAFGAELISVALVCTLTRPDGVKIGLTSLDRAMEGDGLVHVSDTGIMSSAIELGADFEKGSAGIEGALSSWLIRAADLEIGRWFGAEIRLAAADWADPQVDPTPIARGTIGRVARSLNPGDEGFQMEFLSPAERLTRSGAPRCSPTCRASLGDRSCSVDLAWHEHWSVVAEGDERRIRLAGLPIETGLLEDGGVRFLDGPLSGVDRAVVAVDGDWALLDGDLGGLDLSGSRVRLREGCDRRFSTCVERFQNGLNFDGEPHVPGDDMLLRYGDL